MTFTLEKMTKNDENIVYSASKGKTLFGLVRRDRLDGWSVDRDRGMYVYRLRPSDPRLPRARYILSIEDELVIFELDKEGALDVTAKILLLPAPMTGREVELQELFKEGFTAGAAEFIGYESQFGEVRMSFAQQGKAQ